MSEDIEGIEKEIESELSRISVSSFGADDADTELSDEAWSDSETISDDLPESVLSYLNFIKSRNEDAERLILQDLEDEGTTSNIHGVVSCHASDYLAELASEKSEDPEQIQEKVLLEMEKTAFHLAGYNSQCTRDEEDTEPSVSADVEINLTHHEVEEKCRQEFEQWEKRQKELEDEKRKKWKAERKAWEQQNEEEHARRLQHQEELEAERIKLEFLHKKQKAAVEEELQDEKRAWRDRRVQHKEFIRKLQLQMEEEKRALEEQKAKERQHLAEQQSAAAVKIQARVRSFLVQKKYAPILKQWKDEMKKKHQILEEIEREMRVKEEKMKRRLEENRQKKEEEKKRQEELARQEYLQQVRRQEEYEEKKASLRLGREKQLQMRKEQRKLAENGGDATSGSGENNKENLKEDKQTENAKAVREQEEIIKQADEQKEEQIEMMEETNNWIIPAEINLTPTLNRGSEKEHSSQVNNEHVYMNSVTYVEENDSQATDLNEAPSSHTSKDESVQCGANDMVENKPKNICSSSPNAQPNAANSKAQEQLPQSEAMMKTEFLMADANEEIRETQDRIQNETEHLSSVNLPDDIENKRINWMNTCKSWSKIYEEKQRKQVRSPVLEAVPSRSLPAPWGCPRLQALTLRGCGLPALQGLGSCTSLTYINMEENNIQKIDCENLENLCILILNKNQLSSICGLGGCKNLQSLELSYNRITQIDGLESLKNLQQLIVDHNQLISTKGLSEAPALIHLDCSFNHLTAVEGIENCGLLQVLKLQGNDLQEIPRLENHVLLRELYLDDNNISSVRMLSLYWLPLLQILLLSQNSLTELVPLNSFVSLEKLDVKNNCLSDLKDIITWLTDCHKLRDLSLSGNPLLQEGNWRSSLCDVLPSLESLDGEILNNHALITTKIIKGSEPRTFLELCQAQIEENMLLKKKAAEQEAASPMDSAQGQCWYFNQLMKLSVKHRYAHECGELNPTDRDGQGALQSHLKQTPTGCLQENNLFIMGVMENKQGLLDPPGRWITPGHIQAMLINSPIPVHPKENRDEQRVGQQSTESCINHRGESKGSPNMSVQLTAQQPGTGAGSVGRDLQLWENAVERLQVAASGTQSHGWQCHTRRKSDCSNTENHQCREALRHQAATLIQAFWKGFLLRKKLASARAGVLSDGGEDDYREINVDDFIFSEPADPSAHSARLPLSPQQAWQCANRPHSCLEENTHFCSRSEKAKMSQLSDWKEKKNSFMSEKEEKISEEWGFKDISTAQLMLKRAHKMKPKKYNNKTLDQHRARSLFTSNIISTLPDGCWKNEPAVSPAFFRNRENKYLHGKPPRKTQPRNSGYFEARVPEECVQSPGCLEDDDAIQAFLHFNAP